MPDMLVKLYDLPDSRPIMVKMEETGYYPLLLLKNTWYWTGSKRISVRGG